MVAGVARLSSPAAVRHPDPMCLLIVASGVDDRLPLVVAANRDERLERPTRAMTVLQPAGPRILGGRDELAGGTWLAVNRHGVVAGLTNAPRPGGRDPSKRSRGELPLAAAGWPTAEAGAADLAARFRPADYNAAWLLVGDRDAVFFVDMTGAGRAGVHRLEPGIHVLENRALGEASAKVDRVTSLLSGAAAERGDALVERLRSVLHDHLVPRAPGSPPPTGPSDGSGDHGRRAAVPSGGPDPVPAAAPDAGPPPRPAEVDAVCVHTDGYGTRSSTLVRVAATGDLPPVVETTEGPPCTAPWRDRTALWDDVP